MKIIITHTDRDAVGSLLVMSLAMPTLLDDYIISYQNPNTFKKLKEEGIRINGETFGLSSFDDIIITDLEYKDFLKDYSNISLLIDHHPLSDELEDMPFEVVNSSSYNNLPEGKSHCATSLAFHYYKDELEANLNRIEMSRLEKLVEIIRRWDTWDWVNYKPSSLSHFLDYTKKQRKGPLDSYDMSILPLILQYIEDYDADLDLMIHYVKSSSNETRRGILNNSMLDKGINRLYEMIEITDEMKFTEKIVDVNGVKLSLYNNNTGKYFDVSVGCELLKYTSRLQNIGILNIRDNTLILNMRGDGSEDLGSLARKFGGGGHKQACSCPISHEDIKVIERVYNKELYFEGN